MDAPLSNDQRDLCMSTACVSLQVAPVHPRSSLLPTKMPLFNRSLSFRRSKRRNRIKKRDISQPLDFHHCYHAEYHTNTAGFSGLPPQWNTLVGTRSNDPTASELPQSVGDSSNEQAKRPAPIVRGSDGCLEDTVRFLREHYHSLDFEEQSEEDHEEFIDIHLGGGSRSESQSSSRNGSLQQLASPASHVSSRSSTLNRASDHPPSPPHYLGCALDIIHSDLGLYDCNSESLSVCTASSHTINSPSESSGYFGSTMSSLTSSRLSSSQQIATSSSSPSHQALCRIRSYQPYDPHHEPLSAQQRCSSLQRPTRNHREHFPHQQSLYRHHQLRQIQYAAHPRVAKPALSTRMPDPHGQEGSGKTTTSKHQRSRKERQQMSQDRFRATLQSLTNPNDPRHDLEGFVRIGEGSTGNVYTARQISTNKIVAVKKMNLWNQQRKELLFNEVRLPLSPLPLLSPLLFPHMLYPYMSVSWCYQHDNTLAIPTMYIHTLHRSVVTSKAPVTMSFAHHHLLSQSIISLQVCTISAVIVVFVLCEAVEHDKYM